jgi:DNA-binding transcriptional regulator YhcF (GntR family)
MQRALARLEEDGLLYTNRTSGRFVTEDIGRIRQTKNKLAQEQVQEFLKKMTDLGFQQKEIRTILISITEELKK